MAKRQRSVSLSFILLRFAGGILGCMLLCGLIWYVCDLQLKKAGVIYHGSVSNRQVEEMLAGKPKNFVSPGEDFLPEYALFAPDGSVLESNVKGKKLETLSGFLQLPPDDVHVSRYTYADNTTIVLSWYFRTEFVNPRLRSLLPPFEYLWIAALGIAWVLCLMCSTLRLRRHLASRLDLFREVSEKVGAQELDFIIPHAGIKEYDQALDAMDHMRKALYSSLSSQWAAQQEREAEIAALAHDLKTPLTLIGGNAELLLDEELPPDFRRRLEIIASSSDRARQYVASLLETSVGADEAFESASLPDVFNELCRNIQPVAERRNVCLQVQNHLKGTAVIQKSHLLRALGNVVQNAIEHTPEGGNVYLDGGMESHTKDNQEANIGNSKWQIVVRDEGPGFSKAALHHATERLWRDDSSRGSDGHNGLGLWFAAQVVQNHGGELELHSLESGGMVSIRFPMTST